MLLLAGLLLAALSVPLAGGRLGALAELRFRAPWLLAAGLALQILVISVVPGGSPGWHHVAHIASYGLAAAFVIANRRIPFLWLVGGGGLLTPAAIAANGGVMPASPGALHRAGLAAEPGFANSAALSQPRLPFLGDILAVPAGWP